MEARPPGSLRNGCPSGDLLRSPIIIPTLSSYKMALPLLQEGRALGLACCWVPSAARRRAFQG